MQHVLMAMLQDLTVCTLAGVLSGLILLYIARRRKYRWRLTGLPAAPATRPEPVRGQPLTIFA
ncbi:hypothetical protein CHU33_09165, partial [Superficieibacter electus]